MAADNQIKSMDFSAPAAHAYAVTPNDSTDTAYVFRALYVGVAGNVTLTTVGSGNVAGADVVFTAVPAGSILPIIGTRVKATGTTATSIVAMF